MDGVTGIPERLSWRDRLAQHIVQFALQRIATRWYGAFIEAAVRLGMDAAAREAAAGGDPAAWMSRIREQHPY